MSSERLTVLMVRSLLALAAVIASLFVGMGSAAAAAADARYIVQAYSIKALDETGSFNSIGSDEIYGGFSTWRQGSAGSFEYGVQSRVFGNFDVGQTRYYSATQNCLSEPLVRRGDTSRRYLTAALVGPDIWECQQRGISAPFTVTAALFDSESENLFSSCGCGPTASPLDPFRRDDLAIGPRTDLNFSVNGLYADLPQVSMFSDYRFEMKGSGAHYRVTIRVIRVA